MGLHILLIFGFLISLITLPLWIITSNIALALGAHVVSMVFMFLALYIGWVKKVTYNWPGPVMCYALILALFFSTAGSVAGALIIFVKILFGARFKSDLYGEYENYISRDHDKARLKGLYSGLLSELRNEVNFESFIDIIRGKNLSTKQRVIEKLANSPTKGSIKLLKEAIKDRSPEIRFYVAGALYKIEKDITERIKTAVKRVKDRSSGKDYAYLGDLYKTYSDLGLISDGLSRNYLELGCEAYKNAIDMDTGQEDVMASYAECLIKLKRFVNAKALLDEAIKIWPGNRKIIFSRAIVCYELGIYDGIVKSLRDININDESDEVKEVIKLWTS